MSELEQRSVFISYSWTSSEHEKWVLELATDLEQNGVEVRFDKWDLAEGADLYAFMEKAVTDDTIDKVLIVCDHAYADKADNREGGVGTETQIISPNLYQQAHPAGSDQRFIPVVTEKDDSGKAHLPTYLDGRMYVDMADPGAYADGLEQLLRIIYDRPKHERPERGKPPAYIFSNSDTDLGTRSRQRRALKSLKQGRPSALTDVREYFETYASNLDRLELKQTDETWDDLIVQQIDQTLPIRDEAIEVALEISRGRDGSEFYRAIHEFLEGVLPYVWFHRNHRKPSEVARDHFRFLANELFLYVIAALLKYQRFDRVQLLLRQGYYVPPTVRNSGGEVVPYVYFRGYLKSLEKRNKRLNLRRKSLMSDLLKKRANRKDLPFESIMQADLILYLHYRATEGPDARFHKSWFPHTLLYAGRKSTPFELFGRSQSSSFFERLAPLFGISEIDEFRDLVEELNHPADRPWGLDGPEISRLTGLEKLGSLP